MDGLGVLTGIMAINAGSGPADFSSFCLALDSAGVVLGFGGNGFHQTGPEFLLDEYAHATGLTDVTHIAAGAAHSMAIKSDGNVWVLGGNRFGDLGQGTIPNSPCSCFNLDCCSDVPLQVIGPAGAGFLTNVVAIAGGSTHSMALDGAGNVWTWGNDYNGQLGNGTNSIPSATPVAVVGLCDVPTRVPETAQATLMIRPNPTAGQVFLDLSETMRGAEIQLFDGTGRKVLAMRSTGPVAQLDMSTLSPGIYHLQARSISGMWSGRVVKE